MRYGSVGLGGQRATLRRTYDDTKDMNCCVNILGSLGPGLIGPPSPLFAYVDTVLLKPGGCYMLKCRTPPGLHTGVGVAVGRAQSQPTQP